MQLRRFSMGDFSDRELAAIARRQNEHFRNPPVPRLGPRLSAKSRMRAAPVDLDDPVTYIKTILALL